MLTLPIKKKWFDMILSGEKKEEYREIKPYYTTRFKNLMKEYPGQYSPIRKVKFKNGYSKDAPSFIANVTISEGYGLERWGAEPTKEYYILSIRRIEKA